MMKVAEKIIQFPVEGIVKLIFFFLFCSHCIETYLKCACVGKMCNYTAKVVMRAEMKKSQAD